METNIFPSTLTNRICKKQKLDRFDSFLLYFPSNLKRIDFGFVAHDNYVDSLLAPLANRLQK